MFANGGRGGHVRYCHILSASCVVLYCDLFHCFSMLFLQKLTSVGGERMFVGMFKFCLSFHTIAVRGIFHLSLYVTQLHLHFV